MYIYRIMQPLRTQTQTQTQMLAQAQGKSQAVYPKVGMATQKTAPRISESPRRPTMTNSSLALQIPPQREGQTGVLGKPTTSHAQTRRNDR